MEKIVVMVKINIFVGYQVCCWLASGPYLSRRNSHSTDFVVISFEDGGLVVCFHGLVCLVYSLFDRLGCGMLWVLQPIEWLPQTLSILLFFLVRPPHSSTILGFGVCCWSQGWSNMCLLLWPQHHGWNIFLAMVKEDDFPVLKGQWFKGLETILNNHAVQYSQRDDLTNDSGFCGFPPTWWLHWNMHTLARL